MASFKHYLPYSKKDGTFRAVIKLHHHGDRKFIRTEIFISKDDLTKKGKIKSPQIQKELDELIIHYRNKVQKIGIRAESMSIDELYRYIIAENNTEIDFIQYTEKLISKFRQENKKGTASNYAAALNSFKRFVRADTYAINMVTGRLMHQYAEYMAESKSMRFKTADVKVGNRAISLYTGIFRAIINKAKDEFNDEDLDIVTIKVNPFRKFKVPHEPMPGKRSLSIEKIIAIRDIHIDDGQWRMKFARDCFMLSFYLIGMNAVDLYKQPSVVNGRIEYERIKTKSRRSDKAFISIKVEPEALELINRYDFQKLYSNQNTMSRSINYGLKKIGELIGEPNITFYAARHSWATIASNDCGIDKYTIHLALNHVEEEMKITDRYIRKDWSVIDKANRKVLDLLKA